LESVGAVSESIFLGSSTTPEEDAKVPKRRRWGKEAEYMHKQKFATSGAMQPLSDKGSVNWFGSDPHNSTIDVDC
jgi:hypothetical protein